jgi:hypothetical protein
MPPYDENELVESFRAAGDAIAHERPGVEPGIAAEIMVEAAQMLHNSLALEGIDPRDAHTVIAALSADLVAADPGAAVRERAHQADLHPDGLHDPAAAAEAYLTVVQVLRI